MEYDEFLNAKRQLGGDHGFDPLFMPGFLFPFQRDLVEWAVRRGRCGIFADCGLGKTPMQLVWAENVRRKTGRPVLIVTPLAVSHQTIREGEKFGIEVVRSLAGEVAGPITVTNYERLQHFTPSDFAGVVLDESSILKNFDGKRKALVTEFARTLPYRLLCTATAAPNDYVELGTSSEAVGELGHMDMLNRFFKNLQNTCDTKAHWRGNGPQEKRAQWRFKHHAEREFWRWVCSWARALRKPSDLGHDDCGFALPPLREQETCVENTLPLPGELFVRPAIGLKEQRDERRLTVRQRCEEVARKVAEHDDCSIAWCHLNIEGDLLESLIPQSIQVKGQDSDEWKEVAAEWFKGERCICNNPMFRAKLSSWTRNGSAQTPNTCEPTTRPTNTDGTNGAPKSKLSITPSAEGNTTLIQNSESESRRKVGPGENAVHKRDGRETSESSASPSKGTMGCSLHKVEDAQSAEAVIPETSAVHDSTLTTATPLGESGGCSVPLATSDSESSQTVQSALNVPRCICGYRSGKRVLISKPVMFGYGLNLQHCAHMTFFPSHSYEQYYQAVRRCWRFGQTRPVVVDVVTTGGEADVLRNLQRKAEQADRMFEHLVEFMNESLRLERGNPFTTEQEIPSWL